jgi:CBS domain-containing protein
MSPNSIANDSLRHPTPLHADDQIEFAVRAIADSGLPALPVLDVRDRYAGIFGEREFMSALFPGYLNELTGVGFLRRSLDETLERRTACRTELVEQHMTRDHVDVGPDYSDTQVAEIFLHHRVLIVPVVEAGRVLGVITRTDFFHAIAKRFLENSEP